MRYAQIGILLMFLSSTACTKSINQTQNDLATINASNKGAKANPGKEEGRVLTISKSLNLSMPKVQLSPDTVYTSYSLDEPLFTALPAGYEDQINSFRLPKGYMAVFAENSDGSGESVCYVANDSAINATLPERLRNNISFIRYIAINNPDKKGTASTKDATVLAMGTQWFYGWSLNRASFPGQQFVPMTWEKCLYRCQCKIPGRKIRCRSFTII